ncbi:MAG: hypothetical protein E6767_02690 [Dysgonomonas sp.]|nr:hypothetical protein [Dysgonomonas sp.]
MKLQFAKRMSYIKASEIREILMIKYIPGQYRVWKEVLIDGSKEFVSTPFTIN